MREVFLLLLSSRVPYRRAKVSFEPNGAQSLGQAAVPLSEIEPGGLEQLLADPHIIVFASFDGHGFWKVETPEDVVAEELAPQPARDTQAVLAEHARLEAERERAKTGGPEGDEAASPAPARAGRAKK
jgi:hypothetical protein